MANFAEINSLNLVLAVYVIDNDELAKLPGFTNDEKGTLFFDSLLNINNQFIQTSYNGTFRKNFAGIGYTWRPDLDGFVPPMPSENPIDPETDQPIPGNWVLNEQTCNWEFIPTNLNEEK
jgi:hypothetical protein